MQRVWVAAKISAMVAVVIVLLALARFLWVFPALIANEAEKTRHMVSERIYSLQSVANHQLIEWRETTDGQLTALRQMTDRRIASLEKTTDARLASIEQQAFRRADVLVASADRNLGAVSESVVDLTKSYATLPTEAKSYLRPYVDCSTNDYCWPHLVTDSMVSFRATSRDVSDTMVTISKIVPEVSADVRASTNAFSVQFPVIAQNTTNITKNIDRLTKPKWYDRLIGYAANGTLVWFNINRALIPAPTSIVK